MTLSASSSGRLLEGRRTVLLPNGQFSLARLYGLVSKPDAISGWPILGGEVDRDTFVRGVLRESDLMFGVAERGTRRLVGFVQAADEDALNQTVYAHVFVQPDEWRAGWALEGVVLFINYLFIWMGFRKVYFRSNEAEYRRYESACGQWLHKEVVLSNHICGSNGFEDVYYLSLDRSDWPHELIATIVGQRSAVLPAQP